MHNLHHLIKRLFTPQKKVWPISSYLVFIQLLALLMTSCKKEKEVDPEEGYNSSVATPVIEIKHSGSTTGTLQAIFTDTAKGLQMFHYGNTNAQGILTKITSSTGVKKDSKVKVNFIYDDSSRVTTLFTSNDGVLDTVLYRFAYPDTSKIQVTVYALSNGNYQARSVKLMDKKGFSLSLINSTNLRGNRDQRTSFNIPLFGSISGAQVVVGVSLVATGAWAAYYICATAGAPICAILGGLLVLYSYSSAAEISQLNTIPKWAPPNPLQGIPSNLENTITPSITSVFATNSVWKTTNLLGFLYYLNAPDLQIFGAWDGVKFNGSNLEILDYNSSNNWVTIGTESIIEKSGNTFTIKNSGWSTVMGGATVKQVFYIDPISSNKIILTTYLRYPMVFNGNYAMYERYILERQ